MKRYFVIPYLLSLFVVTIFSIIKIVAGEHAVAWVMVLLASVPMLVFMLIIGIFQTARTREHLYPELMLACVGVAGACYTGYLPAIMICGVFGVLGILLYDYWYSSLERETELLKEGNYLPSFVLDTVDGALVSSEALTITPRVWLFIRGNWCPLCVAQVKELAASYRELNSLGVEVTVITPQPSKETQKLAQKFDVPIEFFVDKNSVAADILGLVHKDGVPAGMMGYGEDTVYPTVLITDSEGKILYSDQTQNYRVRPEPEEFIKIITASNVKA